MRITSSIKKLFSHEGDEPHTMTCDDGTVITFGIDDGDGKIRRAKPEDFPEGVWPPIRIGEMEDGEKREHG